MKKRLGEGGEKKVKKKGGGRCGQRKFAAWVGREGRKRLPFERFLLCRELQCAVSAKFRTRHPLAKAGEADASQSATR